MNSLCTKCGKLISNKMYARHEIECGILNCNACGKVFQESSRASFERHQNKCINQAPSKKIKLWEPKKCDLIKKMGEGLMCNYETAFKNRLQSWFILSKKVTDLSTFLQDVRNNLKEKIQTILHEFTSLKVNILVECTFINKDGETQDRAFKTKNKIITKDSDLDIIITGFMEKILNEIEEAEMKKSGWTLEHVDGLRLRINKYNPLKGTTYIKLPCHIEKKKACVNVQNYDEKCFMYSILAKFVNQKPHRVSKYSKLIDRYNFACVSYPTPLEEIKKFEKANNISINVYGLEQNYKVYPLKIVKEELPDHRDLLLINDDSGTFHYVYIKNFERLIGSQMTKHQHSIAVCKRCFTKFDDRYGKTKEAKLEDHLKYCIENKPARIEMPLKKPYVEFEHVERLLKVPYVIYADFESILEPVSGCQGDPSMSYTLPLHKHVPMSYCFYVKASYDVKDVPSHLPTEPILYRGPNAASHFVQQLKIIGEEISRLYSLNIPMHPLTEAEETAFHLAKECYLCDKFIIEDGDKKRDHCHITGKYRGPAHNKCNLRCQNPNFVPVFFHNLTGYDSHFIVKELGYDNEEIEVIPCSEEKYISFSKKVNNKLKLRFLDSIRFISASLDKLVQNLPHLTETSKFFTPNDMKLITRKGVFPYEYISSWEKLDEPHLPPKDAFFSKLTGTDISDKDYKFAQSVWEYFNFKTLGQYSDHYLKTDVLLLADVFENFRNSLNKHKLDPAHYFTTPGLTWDAMLKYTGIQLQLLTDYDMVLMIERGIRGGICQASHRYAKANNYLTKDYNPNEESTFITYQDCNNLYGFAMSKPLPYGGFRWVEGDINVLQLNEDDENGYILEVDIEYPTHLHKTHSDLPFLAENITPPGGRLKKLIPHLGPRTRYVVHYMTLKQALEHGVNLIQIHRILTFKQSRWLRAYIDLNTELRKLANNDFEKDLFKLMNNAVFGKTMENIRKRVNIKLVSDPKKLEKLISKPEFIDRTIYSESLAAVHLMKKSIVFNKPIYLGLSILDISKTTMYQYHYDVMLPKYGHERLKLCYMDTDSFVYFIKTVDLQKDILDLSDYMDTSDFPLDHPCFSLKNKKVLGKFKDEMMGRIISEFIALRAKMYNIRDVDGHEIKKIKGISKNVVQNSITFNHYYTSLFSQKILHTPMTVIQSKAHDVSTIEINKAALSNRDDKRLIMEDGITTLAHGYEHT